MSLPSTLLQRVDPGLVRTSMAGRATLGLVLVGGALLPLVGRLPQTSAIVGIVVGFLVALLTDDETSHGAVVTCAHVAVGSTLLVVMAAVLRDHRAVAYVLFVAVMAVATWARGLGDRATVAGTTALVAYLMATFLQVAPSQLPALLLSVLLAIALVAGMSALMAHNRRERRDGRVVRALLVNGTAVARGARPERMDHAVQLAWERLGPRCDLPDSRRDDVRTHLVRLGLLTEHLRRALHDAERAHDDPPLVEVRHRLIEELDRLADTWDRVATPGAGVGGTARPVARPDQGASRREAIQVAVAGTLAVVLGLWISEERWYWAVIATFVVFVNTGHASATVRKAVERTLGTGVGVIVGTWAAATLAEDSLLELVVAFGLVFAAMWVLQVSYALTIGTITVVLALLLEVLGQLTPRVLVVRFTETAVGAGVGVLVALLVLPVRTSAHLEARRRDVLEAVRAVLDRLEAQPAGEERCAELLDGLDWLATARAQLRASMRARLHRGHEDPSLAALDGVCYWTHRTTWAAIRDGAVAEQVVRDLQVRAEALQAAMEPSAALDIIPHDK